MSPCELMEEIEEDCNFGLREADIELSMDGKRPMMRMSDDYDDDDDEEWFDEEEQMEE